MSNGMKLTSAVMRSVRPRRYRLPRQEETMTMQPYRSRRAASLPRNISSSSASGSSARASAASAAATTTTWELQGSSIIATKGGIARPVATTNPSMGELRNLFATSALPMVGFGFMDNFIMIQAGGYIDSTLGVKFGLATLTAAAMGQVVSDVSGVIFGGAVDNAITRLGLVKPNNLSPAQRRLTLSRRVSMAGAVVGVMIGCGLGATSLLLVPHQNHTEERRDWEKATEIIRDIIESGGIECDECTVYVSESLRLPQHLGLGEKGGTRTDSTRLRIMDDLSLSRLCTRDGDAITSTDRESGKTVRAPIRGRGGNILGILVFVRQPFAFDSLERSTVETEEQIAQLTARHVGAVLDHCWR